MKYLEIVVSGRVQGVCYRAFTLKQANKLGIKGYAKNLVNGNVKVVAFGQDNALDNFINLLKEGPSMARVDDMQISELIPGNKYSHFRIKY